MTVQITPQTLVIAISAVAFEIRQLQEAVDRGEVTAEELQLLDDRLRAAEDLKQAYEVAGEAIVNLPPYETLIRS